jgi:hypothetical protein
MVVELAALFSAPLNPEASMRCVALLVLMVGLAWTSKRGVTPSYRCLRCDGSASVVYWDYMEPIPQQQNPMSLNEHASQGATPPKHHALVGGLALALGAGLSIAAGFLLFSNYFPTGEEAVPVVTPLATATPAVNCQYQQVQCVRAPCPPVWVCESSVATNWISYVNEMYGLTVALPESWKGYSIVTDVWSATATKGSTATMKGPQLHIVHPLSTQQSPRQDIPVMVLTLDEWNRSLSQGWSFGAAPIGPSELARNTKYVFALPARYNYAFPKGFEEVDMIITSKAITAF